MRRRAEAWSEDGAAEALPSDPLADLLFTLIAAVLPAILLLAPLVGRARATVDAGAVRAREAAAAVPAVTVDGRPAVRIVAGAAGLRLPDRGDAAVPLDRIGDDAALQGALADARAQGAPLLLVVEPDGGEGAFALEPVLAAANLADVRALYADEPCASARDAKLRRACGSPSTRGLAPAGDAP